MNQLCSKRIQGINTLYYSRKLRFHEKYAALYKTAFGLERDSKIKILEIGCGPGALAEALHHWYPQAEIIGIDRDSNFIQFAKEKVKGVEFLEAEIENLPFAKESFDVIISNTVSEHIKTELFFGTQYQLLKKGGLCLCISTLKGIRHLADCLKDGRREEEFWAKLEQVEDDLSAYGIGKYRLDEQQLPLVMGSFGFQKIKTDYILNNLTPDNERNHPELALEMIEAERLAELEILEKIKAAHYSFLAETEIGDMILRVNQKYDRRKELFSQGIAQWDCNISLNMVVRGEK